MPVLDIPVGAILAVIALVEGVRRIPDDAVLLQRTPFSGWRVLKRRRAGGFVLLSWWSPCMTTLVLSPAPEELQTPDACFDGPGVLLPALGGCVLVLLIFGIPAGAAWFGSGGFLMAAGATLVLSLGVAALAFVKSRQLEVSAWRSFKWAVPFVSPFAAPRAAEALWQEAVRGSAPALVVRHLVDAATFLDWVRPLAYDARHEGDARAKQLLEGLDLVPLQRAMESTDFVEPGASFYCVRCGGSFVRLGLCPDCGLALKAVSGIAGAESTEIIVEADGDC